MGKDDSRVRIWSWRITGSGPPLTMTLPAMEALKGALSHVSYRSGDGRLPDDFHGGGGTNNRHAYWLPEDQDGDGNIDHVLIYAEAGIEQRVIVQLASVTWFRLGDERYELTPAWMGPAADGGAFGPARTWAGITPYVTPRRTTYDSGKPRPKEAWDLQLADEIEKRRQGGAPLPAIAAIEGSDWRWLDEEQIWTDQFVASRRSKAGPHQDAIAKFVRVTFAEPVSGPLAFGFGAHFGLGLMMPIEDYACTRRNHSCGL